MSYVVILHLSQTLLLDHVDYLILVIVNDSIKSINLFKVFWQSSNGFAKALLKYMSKLDIDKTII